MKQINPLKLGFLVGALLATAAFGQQLNPMLGTGLETSVAVEAYYKSGEAGPHQNGLGQIRGAEVAMSAPIDYLFDGVLMFAAHPEANGSYFELHEAYIRSSKLFPKTRFRIGQFFLGIGRLNRYHRHDWPFVSAPKVHETFFDIEAAKDTGIEVKYLMPTDFYWDILVGVTNGWTFGHSHDIGEKPEVPTHYIRSEHFADLPRNGGVKYGVNYLGRTNAAGTSFTYVGVDAAARWRYGRVLRWFAQTEWWMREQTPENARSERLFGGYLFNSYGVNQQWRVGLRTDWFTNLTLENIRGTSISNGTLAFVPIITWQPSEFSRFSLSYTYAMVDPGAQDNYTETSIELIATYILGSHPAHDY